MSTGSVQYTAEIIPFPVGGRKVQSNQATATELERQAAAAAVSDAWYHEAAINDSRRFGER